MIRFDQTLCRNQAESSSREWLETNGLGGFASGTISGINTRRYHGLLVAATRPPVGRAVLLSQMEGALIVDGTRYEFSSNQYPGCFHPQGFQSLKEFRLDPFPTFTYEVGGVTLEKRIFMVHGENTTVLQYALKGRVPRKTIELELRPLLAFRDYHSLSRENGAINREVRSEGAVVRFSPYQGMPELFLAHNGVIASTQGDWYRRFQYERERERGLDFEEDLFNPCVLTFDLVADRTANLIASTQAHQPGEAEKFRKREIARRDAIAEAAPVQSNFGRELALAADQFIVSRGEQQTVIAGYHWFGDWGRDTMIALPGLTLTTGRFDSAKSILREFAKHVSQGMLPNRFPDSGETPEYNTVDATLWYVEAVRAYQEASGDAAFVRELYPVLCDIMQSHMQGTRHGIRMEEATGLLHAGEPGVQLTWMDAKVGDWVVTPRIGKPVEIQALWYNALRIMGKLAGASGDAELRKRFEAVASLAQDSFNRLFWNETLECLYDVVEDASPDASLRPNQVFAVSLPYSMLTPERARKVVDLVQRELLTPLGLRTLPRNDSRYAPRYEGGVRERDGVYHQGTVWPWLIGPFISAYLKTHVDDPQAGEKASIMLLAFEGHLEEAGLGQISEILDADRPYAPRGCIAQAWSVAEVLRSAANLEAAAAPVMKPRPARAAKLGQSATGSG